jgi:hypothetical protein
MRAETLIEIRLICPVCKEPGKRVDFLEPGRSTITDCDECGAYMKVERHISTLAPSFEVEVLKDKKHKVIVPLQSETDPPITLKVADWVWPSPDIMFYQDAKTKEKGAREMTPEETWEAKLYYYNVHICPTSALHYVKEVICQDVSDPHGLFRFVSVEFPKEEE